MARLETNMDQFGVEDNSFGGLGNRLKKQQKRFNEHGGGAGMGEDLVKKFWKSPDIQNQIANGQEIRLTWDKAKVLFWQLFGEVEVNVPQENTHVEIKVGEVNVVPRDRDFGLTVNLERISGQLKGNQLPIPDNSVRLQASVENKLTGVGIKITDAKLEGQSLWAKGTVAVLKGVANLAGYKVDEIITQKVIGASDEDMQQSLVGFLEEGTHKKVEKPKIILEKTGIKVMWSEIDSEKGKASKSQAEQKGEKKKFEPWKCREEERDNLKRLLNYYEYMMPQARSKMESMKPVMKALETAGVLERIKKDVEAQVFLDKRFFIDDRFNILEYLHKTFDNEIEGLTGDIKKVGNLNIGILRSVFAYMKTILVDNIPYTADEPVGKYTTEFLAKGKKEGRMNEGENMMQASDYFRTENRRRFTDELGSSVIMTAVDEFIEGGSGDSPRTWHGKPMVELWVKLSKGADDCTPYLEAVKQVLREPGFGRLTSEKAMERIANALVIRGSDRNDAEEYALVLDLFNRAKLDKNSHPIIMKKTSYLLLGDY